MSDLQHRMAAAAAKLGLPDEDEPKQDTPYLIKDEQLEVNWDESWTRYESGYYFHDENHSGCIYVSQRMVGKYKLNHTVLDEEWFNDEMGVYGDDEEQIEYLRELQAKYAQEIYISHATAFSAEGCSREHHRVGDRETPHGDIGSENFVAWWNDFPVELLKEAEDDVYIAGWCDG